MKSGAAFCFLFVTILQFACKNSAGEEPRSVDLNQVDTTYSQEYENFIIRTPVDNPVGELTLPAIAEYDEIIRFRAQDGWGVFDYLCSVYTSSEKVAIQAIRQETSLDSRVRSYKINERFLSQEEYSGILQLLVENDFAQMTFDLEPQIDRTDGNRFYLVHKSGERVKTVTWQNVERFRSEDHEAVERIAYTLLEIGNCPLQGYWVRKVEVEGDSVKCFIGLHDQILFDSLKIESIEKLYQGIFQDQFEYSVIREGLTTFMDSLTVSVHTPTDEWIVLPRKGILDL